MRSRNSSPLLPYSTSGRLPTKQRSRGSAAATRVLLLTTTVVLVCWGGYSALGYFGGTETASATGIKGRGLAAHEEVAQLQGKNAPVLKGQDENAQLQGQVQKAPVLEGMGADQAARGVDSAERLVKDSSKDAQGLYSLSVEDSEGKLRSLAEFAGKVALVVNTASECGFTDSNMRGLQQLYEKYKASGFEILAFPCSDFKQEPGSNEVIQEFAKTRYGITFPIFAKTEVNGADAAQVFKFLKKNLPVGEGGGGGSTEGNDLAWNFHKILVGRNGMPVKHYDSAFDAEQLERDLNVLLMQPA